MPFTFGIPFTKVSKDDTGKMVFEGVASSTSLDTHNCRMAKSALESMEAFRGIDLLPSHKAGPLTELGTVDEIHLIDNQVFVKGTLDGSNPDAIRLYENLQKGKDYGLSVGGKIAKAHFELEKGRRVRVLDTVVLDHVALTRAGEAANPDAFIAIAKSAEEEYPIGEEDMIHDNIKLISDQLEKVTGYERDALQRSIHLLRSECGCDECKASLSETLEKSDASTSFSVNIRADVVEEALRDKLSNFTWTLRETLEAIALSDTGDKSVMVDTALAEFSSAVRTAMNIVVTIVETTENLEKSEGGSNMSETTEQISGQTTEETTGDELMKSITERLDALEKQASDKDARIEELETANQSTQEELAKAQARVAELEAVPAAGGPINTAAAGGNEKLGKDNSDKPDKFAEQAAIAKSQPGTTAAMNARREAQEMAATIFSGVMATPRQ